VGVIRPSAIREPPEARSRIAVRLFESPCLAELLFTTDAFVPHGLTRPGVPMLVDREMRLIEPACAWLLHVALVRDGRAVARLGVLTAKRCTTGGKPSKRTAGLGTKSVLLKSLPTVIGCLVGLAIIPEGLSHAARSMAAFERWHSFIDGA